MVGQGDQDPPPTQVFVKPKKKSALDQPPTHFKVTKNHTFQVESKRWVMFCHPEIKHQCGNIILGNEKRLENIYPRKNWKIKANKLTMETMSAHLSR